MANYQSYKIPIFPDINDAPIVPTATTPGNGSHLIARYNEALDAVQTDVTQQTTAFNTVQTSVAELTTALDTVETSVTQLATALNTVETSVTQLETASNAIQTSVSELETRLEAIESAQSGQNGGTTVMPQQQQSLFTTILAYGIQE